MALLLATLLAALSNWSRARAILAWLRSAQSPSVETGCNRSRPRAVKAYATRGGTVVNTVRVRRPSRSRPRKVRVSIRCEMPPIERRNSLNRNGPPPSRVTTRTDHLSPTRASTSLTARQSAGKCLYLGFIDVPSWRSFGVTYLPLVTTCHQGIQHAQLSPSCGAVAAHCRDRRR